MKFAHTRALCLFVALCMCLTMIPVKAQAASALPDEIYLVQESSGTCTLTAAAMMLRARMYLSGNSDWSKIDQSAIRSVAWINGTGLRWSFTYTLGGSSISVKHAAVSGGISSDDLKALLDEHPEGISLYCGGLPHAVFLTDYDGDTFYCADPAGYWGGKRIPLAESYNGVSYGGSQATVLSKVTAYWYVSSYSISAPDPTPELPYGAIDLIDVTTRTLTAYGWAFDTDDVSRALEIQVYLGDALIGEGIADIPREDVDMFYGAGEDHGFEISCPLPEGCTGIQTVTVCTLDEETDTVVTLGTAEIEIPVEPDDPQEDPDNGGDENTGGDTPENGDDTGDDTNTGTPSLGDVNGDGNINILDANLAAAYYNEVIDLTEEQLLAADVNGDGNVNILDANLIAAYYNEVIDAFPAV